MSNINDVYLSFPTSKSNYLNSYKSNEVLNKENNIFHYFNSKTSKDVNNNQKKNKNTNKKLLTNFSSSKEKLRIYTDLNEYFAHFFKRKGINFNSYNDSKKKVNINNLFFLKDKKEKLRLKEKYEENKIDLNPIFNFKKDENKSRNTLSLKEDDTYMTSKEKKFFTCDTFSTFNKDIFNIKVNLRNSKNFSLYKNKLTNTKTIQTKSSITEYNQKSLKNSFQKTKRRVKYFYPFKTRYIFKTRDIIPTTKFKGLPENVKQMNKYYLNSVKLETNKYFGSNFSILRKEHFSDKFRNPLLNNNLLSEQNLVKEEKYKKINEDIISGKGILDEIYLAKIKNVKRKNLNSIGITYFKFKIWLIKFSEFCKILEIKPFKYIEFYYKFYNNKDITFYETQQIKTSDLINAIKTKNLKLSNQLIEAYPTIVMNKDYFEYSPLHWAVKIKFIEIIPNLILYGSNPNTSNYLGETPLHLSVKNNDYDITVILLIFMASPFIKNNKGKKPFDNIDDYQMKVICKTIINLYYINTFKRSKFFIKNVQNKFIDFIMEEFKTQISKETLDIIEQIWNRINKGKNKEKN